MPTPTKWKANGPAPFDDPNAWSAGLPNSTTVGMFSGSGIVVTADPMDLIGTALQFTDDATAIVSVASDSTFDATSEIDVLSGSDVTFSGAPGLVNDGLVQVEGAGSLLQLSDPITGTGTLAVGSRGELDLLGSVGSDQTVRFLDDTGTIGVQVGSAGLSQIQAPILGMKPGDTISVLIPQPSEEQIDAAYVRGGVLTFYGLNAAVVGTLNVPDLPDGTQFDVKPDHSMKSPISVTETSDPLNLVENNSFEDDALNWDELYTPVSHWTLSGPDINAGETEGQDPVLVGPNYLAIGTVGTLGFVSQTIPTIAGQTYTFSFDFSSDGAASNKFEALWNGSVVMNVAGTPFDPIWTNGDPTYSFAETASSDLTTIAFGGEGNGTSYIGVDDVSVTPVNCFVQGTRIRTARSERAVETLVVGGWVKTNSGADAQIKWIGRRHVDCRQHGRPEQVWPVRISAGAFGRQMPHRDLLLSPDHAVFLDGVLIPIKYLVNGTTIAQEAWDEVTYYHVELDRHDVIMAEGLACESYLDADGRRNFTNGGGVTRLFPDFSAPSHDAMMTWEARGYAPLVTYGPKLDAVRALVNAQVPATGAASAVEPTNRTPRPDAPRTRYCRTGVG